MLAAGEDGDSLYLVTEYIDGQTLQHAVAASGPWVPHLVAGFAAGTALALQVIHHAGVVHGDFKPSNVLLSATGGPRVIDFGIARAAEFTTTLAGGRVLGTRPYMAPEHYLGRDVTAATDVFAWAATVTYAATGQPPFGHDDAQLPERIMHRAPELGRMDAGMREIVEAALAKNPAKRPSAAALLKLLGQLGQPEPLTDPDSVEEFLKRTWTLPDMTNSTGVQTVGAGPTREVSAFSPALPREFDPPLRTLRLAALPVWLWWVWYRSTPNGKDVRELFHVQLGLLQAVRVIRQQRDDAAETVLWDLLKDGHPAAAPAAGITLGNLYRDHGELDLAVAAYQRTIALDGFVAAAMLNFARVRWQQQRLEDAAKLYEAVEEEWEGCPIGRDAFDEWRRLRSANRPPPPPPRKVTVEHPVALALGRFAPRVTLSPILAAPLLAVLPLRGWVQLLLWMPLVVAWGAAARLVQLTSLDCERLGAEVTASPDTAGALKVARRWLPPRVLAAVVWLARAAVALGMRAWRWVLDRRRGEERA